MRFFLQGLNSCPPLCVSQAQQVLSPFRVCFSLGFVLTVCGVGVGGILHLKVGAAAVFFGVVLRWARGGVSVCVGCVFGDREGVCVLCVCFRGLLLFLLRRFCALCVWGVSVCVGGCCVYMCVRFGGPCSGLVWLNTHICLHHTRWVAFVPVRGMSSRVRPRGTSNVQRAEGTCAVAFSSPTCAVRLLNILLWLP